MQQEAGWTAPVPAEPSVLPQAETGASGTGGGKTQQKDDASAK